MPNKIPRQKVLYFLLLWTKILEAPSYPCHYALLSMITIDWISISHHETSGLLTPNDRRTITLGDYEFIENGFFTNCLRVVINDHHRLNQYFTSWDFRSIYTNCCEDDYVGRLWIHWKWILHPVFHWHGMVWQQHVYKMIQNWYRTLVIVLNLTKMVIAHSIASVNRPLMYK